MIKTMTKKDLKAVIDEIKKSSDPRRSEQLGYFGAWLEYYEANEQDEFQRSNPVIRACHLLGLKEISI